MSWQRHAVESPSRARRRRHPVLGPCPVRYHQAKVQLVVVMTGVNAEADGPDAGAVLDDCPGVPYVRRIHQVARDRLLGVSSPIVLRNHLKQVLGPIGLFGIRKHVDHGSRFQWLQHEPAGDQPTGVVMIS